MQKDMKGFVEATQVAFRAAKQNATVLDGSDERIKEILPRVAAA